MDLHEYQAKLIMQEYQINVPYGLVAKNEDEFLEKANKVINKNGICVVKAQVHAGGRGKAGGVKVYKDVEEAIKFAKKMFNSRLITKQTDSDGQLVSSIYFEEGCKIKKEYYLSFLIDREKNCVSVIVSTEGGMDIEEVSEKNPEKIHTINIFTENFDVLNSYKDYHTKEIIKCLELEESNFFLKAHDLLSKIYRMFVQKDISLLEINPLVLTDDNNLIVLDGKINIDDNGLFRQNEIKDMRDKTQEDELDSYAKDAGLSYVRLDGNIGCMVNGAGLAMATMDIIKYYGGSPANFLDVGGGADSEGIKTALEIILKDGNVKAVLINIFGGIVQCDMVAEAVIKAIRGLLSINNNKVLNFVIRLSGTKSNIGSKIIADFGSEKLENLNIVTADDLDDAAKKIVDMVK
jgi:succinyl-CoA synthetase beta subunit